MLQYLRAKTIEYQLMLHWLEAEIASFEIAYPQRDRLLHHLFYIRDELRILLDRIDAIVKIADARLFPRAVPMVHEIEYYALVLTSYYIPALQREQNNDRKLRRLLLDTTKRLGLNWIEDLVIRLDGSHATVTLLSETPVIFLPPQHAISLVDMPGLYHEFGHNVFQKHDHLGNSLLSVVKSHFFEVRKNVGLLSPEKAIERNRIIDNAESYWNLARLEETFCDIFATYVCGPAHYYSCVDLGLRHDRNPFSIDYADEHPPFAARVMACLLTVEEQLKNLQYVSAAKSAWNDRLSSMSKQSNYDLICAETLINELAVTVMRDIERLPCQIRKYRQRPIEYEDIQTVDQTWNLEDLINAGNHVLITFPSDYIEWERKILPIIFSNENAS